MPLKERDWLVLIVALCTIVFAPTLRFDFVYDDRWVITDNGFLRAFDLWALWTGAAAEAHVPDAQRPVAVMFERALFEVAGVSPALHHGLSVLVHAVAVTLLWRWLVALGAPIATRLGTTAAFGLMACHAEAIAVVSFREDLLAAALAFAALRAVARNQAATAALTSFAAAATKESTWLLPLLGYVATAYAPWREPMRDTQPLRRAVMAAGCGVLAFVLWRTFVLGDLATYENPARMAYAASPWERLAAQVVIAAQQLVQVATGFGAQTDHPNAARAVTDPAVALCLAGLLGWCGVCVARRQQSPQWWWISALAVLAYLPVANLWPLVNQRADRYLYFASTPLALAAGMGLHAAIRADRPLTSWRGARWTALWGLWLCVQGAWAPAQARAYASVRQLWSSALRDAPHAPRAHAVMGQLLAASARDTAEVPDAGVVARATAHCELAWHYAPGHPQAHACLGQVRALAGDYRTAKAHFADAAQGMPGPADRWLARRLDLGLSEADGPIARDPGRYPYSIPVALAAARAHHRAGQREATISAISHARTLGAPRWELEVLAAELELDAGDWPAASARLGAIRGAPPGVLRSLRARLRLARLLFPTPAAGADLTSPSPRSHSGDSTP